MEKIQERNGGLAVKIEILRDGVLAAGERRREGDVVEMDPGLQLDILEKHNLVRMVDNGER